eukprot:UC4_evm1s1299
MHGRTSCLVSSSSSSFSVLHPELYDRVRSCRLLLVGAGGIGCELLKNLVLTGFGYIHIIDLDTIDVSNLNRQFLFRKHHVGKPKAHVARESALAFNPSEINIVSEHGSIIDAKYGVDFYRGFDLVLNALDNNAARVHVNRLCLAADIPLIESGTKGYLGQVQPIIKGKTECFECLEKTPEKTYPVCTIRNTPSAPIHCIVWAKYLFGQLFDVPDEDNDVAPNTDDPELLGSDSGVENSASTSKRKTTRQWAEEKGYDARWLFLKLFKEDIVTLKKMDKLWEKRTPPKPLWDELLPPQDDDHFTSEESNMDIWSLKHCVRVFCRSIRAIWSRVSSKVDDNGKPFPLSWDKDDDDALDFVAAASNLRSHNFDIPKKSHFDVKSMAGKIIPAIATTNAVIAGLIVLEAIKILDNRQDQLKNVYLKRTAVAGKIINTVKPEVPKKTCFACAPRAEVIVKLDTNEKTIGFLQQVICCESLGLVAPDATKIGPTGDGLPIGSQIITSEEEDIEHYKKNIYPKTLTSHGVIDGTQLEVEDFVQPIKFRLVIRHVTEDLPEEGFELLKSNMDLSNPSQIKTLLLQSSSENKTVVLEDGEDDRSETSGKRMRDESDGNGRSATVDGDSTFVAYNADSGSLFGSLGHLPARRNIPQGTTRSIWDWDSSEYLGEIIEANETYNVVGNMNEFQLTIGETTFGGLESLSGQKGPDIKMDYGNLIWVTLQRAKTAREAISVAAGLMEEYGYASEGESFSIADPHEVWLMEIIGKGPGEKGAVWVASKLPEGYICSHANQARTRTFAQNDPENVRYSPDVVTFAQRKGLYPKDASPKDFSFSDIYDPVTFT